MACRNIPAGAACVVALLFLPACDWTTPGKKDEAELSATRKLASARRLKRACGSAETYDRLKALAFDEATKIRSSAFRMLDMLSANATVRMERPVAVSRDEALDITVCEGHFILELPPGIQDAFGGARRLEADVEYSAHEAADGSGLVYQMQGAEPIIYRLAALTLPGEQGERLAQASPQPAAEAVPALMPAPAAKPMTPAPPEPARPAKAAAPPPMPTPARRPPAPESAMDPAPSGTARPSFNCRGVSSRVLRMVCSDAGLAAQDRRMSSVFYAALASGDGSTRQALRASRDRFLSARNRCPDRACVDQAYRQRIAEIRRMAGGG